MSIFEVRNSIRFLLLIFYVFLFSALEISLSFADEKGCAELLTQLERWHGPGYFSDFAQNYDRLVSFYGDSSGVPFEKKTFEERLRLFRQFSVHPQTHWMRHENQLSAFDQIVFARLKKKKAHIEIASVGCSRGHEVYSILLRQWRNRAQFKITGIDVNPLVLQEARVAKYRLQHYIHGERTLIPYEFEDIAEGKKIEKILSEALSFEHGNCFNTHFSFSNEAKKYVEFEQHDILLAPLDKKYDVIFLNNVLRHYVIEGRKQILANIHASLNPGGWLLCEGPTEGARDAAGQDGVERAEWMRRLSQYGFEKQKTLLRLSWSGSSEKSDYSSLTEVYRKK